jgi:hypothetical protein
LCASSEVRDSVPVLRLFLLEQHSGIERLRAALPPHRTTPLGLEIPLGDFDPEEILALCLRFGVTARATRIVGRTSLAIPS